MRFALHALCVGVLVSVAGAGGAAWAGPANAGESSGDPTPSPSPTEDPGTAAGETPVQFGLGVRLRSVWVPKSILELFIERAAGGAQNYGIGVELSRRRGTTELQLGFEYERVNVGQGVWINKGDDVALGDEADFILGPKASGHQLGWATVEFTFLNHAEIGKHFAVRYGGGIGLGVVLGELDHYNVICAGATNASPEPGCTPPRFGGNAMYSPDPGGETAVAYSLPPVFPVVNAILGLEIKPNSHMTINLEGGIRTLPFAGISTSVFF